MFEESISAAFVTYYSRGDEWNQIRLKSSQTIKDAPMAVNMSRYYIDADRPNAQYSYIYRIISIHSALYPIAENR